MAIFPMNNVKFSGLSTNHLQSVTIQSISCDFKPGHGEVVLLSSLRLYQNPDCLISQQISAV